MGNERLRNKESRTDAYPYLKVKISWA